MEKNIGDEIKLLREQAKMTQTDLAIELGVTKSTISAYENGTRFPSYKMLIKLNEVLRLFDYERPKEKRMTIDITDLTSQQQDIIRMTVKQFRKGNELLNEPKHKTEGN